MKLEFRTNAAPGRAFPTFDAAAGASPWKGSPVNITKHVAGVNSALKEWAKQSADGEWETVAPPEA